MKNILNCINSSSGCGLTGLKDDEISTEKLALGQVVPWIYICLCWLMILIISLEVFRIIILLNSIQLFQTCLMVMKGLNNMQSFILSGRQLIMITSHSSHKYRVRNMTRNKQTWGNLICGREIFPRLLLLPMTIPVSPLSATFCLQALMEKGCFLNVLLIPLSCMILEQQQQLHCTTAIYSAN